LLPKTPKPLNNLIINSMSGIKRVTCSTKAILETRDF